jgi:hypothetical protein
LVSWHTIEVEESKDAIPKDSSVSCTRQTRPFLSEISISFKNPQQLDAMAHR